jgi:hypothetical protein
VSTRPGDSGEIGSVTEGIQRPRAGFVVVQIGFGPQGPVRLTGQWKRQWKGQWKGQWRGPTTPKDRSNPVILTSDPCPPLCQYLL